MPDIFYVTKFVRDDHIGLGLYREKYTPRSLASLYMTRFVIDATCQPIYDKFARDDCQIIYCGICDGMDMLRKLVYNETPKGWTTPDYIGIHTERPCKLIYDKICERYHVPAPTYIQRNS